MRAHPARQHLALALALISAAFVASCSKELPNAPTSRSAPNARHFPSRAALRDFDNQVVVTLTSGASAAELAARYGASVLEWEANQRVAILRPGANGSTASLLAALSADPHVTTFEQNERVEPAEARQKSFAFDDGLNTLVETEAQPALEALHVDAAHGVSIGGGVKVAVLDTGIDPDHPLLRNHIVAAWDFIEGHAGATDVVGGVDTNDDGVFDEAWGHGTHVAGIVSLTAPGAQLLIGRVLDSDGQGDVMTVAAGIRWAVQNGAQVINLSLGSLGSSSAISEALHEAQAHGIVVVASAGNWGAEQPQEYPARSDEVTAAVAACDVNAVPAQWTSYGNFVDITAPGIAIRSAYPGGRYRLWSGTSMSAPFVAGTAAMLISDHPNWTPLQVQERIGEFARPLTGLSAAQAGKLGAGMLDVGAAITPDGDSEEPPVEGYIPGHH